MFHPLQAKQSKRCHFDNNKKLKNKLHCLIFKRWIATSIASLFSCNNKRNGQWILPRHPQYLAVTNWGWILHIQIAQPNIHTKHKTLYFQSFGTITYLIFGTGHERIRV
jgi:hypothetical protein